LIVQIFEKVQGELRVDWSNYSKQLFYLEKGGRFRWGWGWGVGFFQVGGLLGGEGRFLFLFFSFLVCMVGL
jgi:hypothetical protein